MRQQLLSRTFVREKTTKNRLKTGGEKRRLMLTGNSRAQSAMERVAKSNVPLVAHNDTGRCARQRVKRTVCVTRSIKRSSQSLASLMPKPIETSYAWTAPYTLLAARL